VRRWRNGQSILASYPFSFFLNAMKITACCVAAIALTCTRTLTWAALAAPPPPPTLAAELRSDGESIFCDASGADELSGDGGRACRRSWRYAVTTSCTPTCQAYSLQQQQKRATHLSLYTQEECEQRGRAACMMACVADQLATAPGGADFDPGRDPDSRDFIGSLVFSFGDATRRELRPWFLNATDAARVAGKNATLLGAHGAALAKQRLDSFWASVCGSGGETRLGRTPCADEFKDPGGSSDVHFAYLDDATPAAPRAAFLERAQALRHAAPPRSPAAEEASAALRRVLRVDSPAGVELVRRWVGAAFLREALRVAGCAAPAP